MGRLWRELRSFFRLRGVTLSLIVWGLLTASVLTGAAPEMRCDELMRQLLGGVAPRGTIDIMAVFRWAAGVCPGILLSLAYIDEMRGGRMCLVLPRTTRRRFWGGIMGVVLLGSGLYTLCGMGLLLAISAFAGHAFYGSIWLYLAVWVLFTLCVAVTALTAGVLGAVTTPVVGQAYWVLLHAASAVGGCRGVVPRWCPSGCYGMMEQVGTTPARVWGVIGVQMVLLGALWAFGYRRMSRL